MQVLLYRGLDLRRIPNFATMKAHLQDGEFRAAGARKAGQNPFCPRLNRFDRLLFCFARHGGDTYVLMLKYIANHAYDSGKLHSGGGVHPLRR